VHDAKTIETLIEEKSNKTKDKGKDKEEREN